MKLDLLGFRRRLGTNKFGRNALVLLYGFALLQFVRFYTRSTTFYLKLPAYLHGHERLPFQERILPILFMRPIVENAWIMQHFAHENGAFTTAHGAFYLLSLVSLALAAVFTQKLYGVLTETDRLNFLIFPVFLYIVMWTYVIHSEANFSYPYDFLSLAFFTAGLYFIYTQRFWWLFAVVLIGTFNRETTLFLIGLFVIDTGFRLPGSLSTGSRFHLRSVPWVRVLVLGAVWFVIKTTLKQAFRHNDASEDFLRIDYNLNLMRLRLVPALLNLCGYVLPLIVIFRRYLYPERFRRYLLILVPWLAVMFLAGVLVETRIYGELCSYTAVAAVLILEQRVNTPTRSQDTVAEEYREAVTAE